MWILSNDHFQMKIHPYIITINNSLLDVGYGSIYDAYIENDEYQNSHDDIIQQNNAMREKDNKLTKYYTHFSPFPYSYL